VIRSPSSPQAVNRHYLLGPLGVRGTPDARSTALLARPKRLALLTLLIGSGPIDARQRDEILAVFWPDATETPARTSLRQALQVLRRVLGAAAIPNSGTGVRVDPALC
jgi:DNA-binding SARP family transcriptional activator